MFVPDPEIIHARVVMYFMARLTKGYWQDVGCCLQTFMQEKLFGLRRGIHPHVCDAVFRLIHMFGRGHLCNAVVSRPNISQHIILGSALSGKK